MSRKMQTVDTVLGLRQITYSQKDMDDLKEKHGVDGVQILIDTVKSDAVKEQ